MNILKQKAFLFYDLSYFPINISIMKQGNCEFSKFLKTTVLRVEKCGKNYERVGDERKRKGAFQF